MRKLAMIVSMLALVLVAAEGASLAETAQKGNLGVGGYFGIGGVTKSNDGGDGAFALGIQPEVQYFVINNLSVDFRLLWERYFYSGAALDVFPFVFGARYYIPIIPKLKIPVGAGLGFTVNKSPGQTVTVFGQTFGAGGETHTRFMIDMHGGVEYEVIPNLGVVGLFDINLPNLAPTETGEKVVGRFMIFGGVTYYIGL